VRAHLADARAWVQDLRGGADPRRLPIRLVTESPWHALFARNLFLPYEGRSAGRAQARVPHPPRPVASRGPARDGTRPEAFVVSTSPKKIVLIGGTEYAGEIKKSIFTVLNFLLPLRGVFPMHCSANLGSRRHVALFFGLSGTGKTTLSADPDRPLIGDDEHGWSDDGVFNFEGGCYAKVIRLNATTSPRSHDHATFGTCSRMSRSTGTAPGPRLRREDREHARAYPLQSDRQHRRDGRAGIRERRFLTADAFGVLPPIAKLTPSRRCISSSPATRPRSPAPSAA
jgi:phosphoenolpyruvate carboxykinase (ATP)